MMRSILYTLSLVFLLTSCGGNPDKANKDTEQEKMERALMHSYAIPSESRMQHLSWDAEVDFEGQRIVATATFDLENSADADRFMLDMRDLKITEVLLDGQVSKEWWIGPKDQFLGSPLEIAIQPSTQKVSVRYETTDGALALQWLNPQQTAGKEHPFLYTQSQAILARTWIPIQDSPGIRFSYDAHVKVPQGLMAVMSASNPTEIDSTGEYSFKMEQPIPSYLMALAVGDLRFQAIGDETGVYAEPSMLEASVYEFGDMQKMLESAEALYGKYAWDRYDVLVLPPSFPFGGMENPRLTFATPTILAGDRSLTALIAHELAHSWSGNLATNRTWNDFWLNEGFTVYFERRIMEALYGDDYESMLQILGRQDLFHTLEELGEDNPDTRLRIELEGRDPDDGMTDIAYEKGNAFLMMLEEATGRERFDAFLNRHFSDNAFKSVDTETFLESVKLDLLGGDQARYDELKIDEWVYQPGLADNAVHIESEAFENVEAALADWMKTGDASVISTDDWTTHHWLHFLRSIPDSISKAELSALDQRFGFTTAGNTEIAAEWFVLAIEHDYHKADASIEAFLIKVGRRKFLVPIYSALAKADPSLERPRSIYSKARENYHSVSVRTLDELLKWEENGTES